MDVISFSKAKNAEKIAKAADARLTQALKDSKPIDQVSDALVDSKAVRHDTLKKRLDSRDVSVDASLNAINTQLGQSNRTTQVLQTGVNVVNSEVAAPATFQIEGRTLVNMGNSDLQDGRYYVLADKKTKVKAFRDDTWKQGVAKFQRENSLITKSDFTGKVSGSVVENPHIAKASQGVSLLKPSDFTFEFGGATTIKSLDGQTDKNGRATVNNEIAQQLYSFNIIEHIERKIGSIPKLTLTDKVQWIRDNVEKIICNWWGKGTGPNGNKAYLQMWNGTSWVATPTHTSNTVSKLTIGVVVNYIDSIGYIHLLAYADPSDGTTPSTIETDYIELEVTLKTTAQLNKKPIFSRVANFEGKILGSTVENPHMVRRGTGHTTLMAPGSGVEETQVQTEKITALDGVTNNFGAQSSSGAIAQQMFSFNIIEEVERNIGKIPSTNKRKWLWDNVNKLTYRVHAYGTGPNGFKVTSCMYRLSYKDWVLNVTNTKSTPSLLQGTESLYLSDRIDLDGYAHIIVYADPSDGITASTVYTDYVELEIELKPEAVLINPTVPFYEVPKTEYDQILLGWNEAEVLNRYPRVEGMKHIKNAYVVAENENILPSFYDNYSLASMSDSDITIKGPYDLEVTNSWSISRWVFQEFNVIPNQMYSIKSECNNIRIGIFGTDGQTRVLEYGSYDQSRFIRTFNSGNWSRLRIYYNVLQDTTDARVKNVMISLGVKDNLFTPRNPSYFFTQSSLGKIGTKNDMLFKENGEWKIRKEIEKDIVLDGNLGWRVTPTGTKPEFKEFMTSNIIANSVLKGNVGPGVLVLPNGKIAGPFISSMDIGGPGSFYHSSNATSYAFYYRAPHSDTGFGAAYNPTEDEIKAFMNGWKVKAADGNGKPTSWISLVDGTDAPTQTLTYVKSTYPSRYTPFNLSYVIGNPVTEPAQVEGDVMLSGSTQIDVSSGLVVKEKVIPKMINGATFVHINYKTDISSQTKNKTKNILGVYKDGLLDKDWIVEKSNTAWKTEDSFGVYTTSDKYDPKSVYTISYVVLEKEKFTTSNIGTKVIYSRNLRDAHDDLVKQLKDTSTQLSVTNKMLIDLYVQYKALKP